MSYQIVTATGSGENGSIFADPAHSTDFISQGFLTSGAGTVSTVLIQMIKRGTPTGNLTATIYSRDGSGYPTGAAIATSDVVDATTISTSMAGQTFNYSSPPSLSASTGYCVVITSSGTPSATNYFGLGGTATDTYANGKAAKSASANSGYSDNAGGGAPDVYWEINVTTSVATKATFILNMI